MTEDSSVSECVYAFMLWFGVRRGPLINSWRWYLTIWEWKLSTVMILQTVQGEYVASLSLLSPLPFMDFVALYIFP